ncbi:nucleotidyltransferase domain-containing protein [Burkholderia pyrrocinia]|uniref:nucleotidyltransferase domain-containing protein n=1 Tax=Burkholderia pyrrocinia TaxID=60550 RepID=UPI000AE16756|nr:amino acid transporter [Burkholderia pyrrocinia]
MAIPDQQAWNAWQPATLAQRLSDIHLPWCVVGGWALDLWHGARTREHDDLEFTILREDFGRFRQALSDLAFYTAHAGVVGKLPENQEPPPEVMQFWGFDRAAECWRVDMMIEPGTPEWWAYKRDPSIRRPRAAMVMRTTDDIPYLNPTAVLLFKARDRRPKDQQDFDRALPKLPVSERVWLKDCLGALHPGNEWARAL